MTFSSSHRGPVLLPTPLLVAVDALGSQFDVELSTAELQVTLPALPSEDPEEFYDLVCPIQGADEMVALMASLNGDRGGWGGVAYAEKPGSPRILASKVRAVALEAVLADVDLDVPMAAMVLGEIFDAWWSDVLTWLELWTPQHLIPDANAPLRSRGHVYDMRSQPAELTGWSHGGEIRAYRSEQAVTQAMFSSAFSGQRWVRDRHFNGCCCAEPNASETTGKRC